MTSSSANPSVVSSSTPSANLRRPGLAKGRLRAWGWWLILLALVSGGVAYLTRGVWIEQLSGQATVRTGESNKAREYVSALGRLEPAGNVVRVAPKSGNEGASVEALLVKEGEDAYAGKTIAILDSRDRRAAALAEAESQVKLAEAKLERVKSGAKPADIRSQEAAAALVDQQSKVALRDLNRTKQLARSDVVSDELLEQRQWEYDRLLLEHERLVSLVESTKEVREVDIAVAEQEIAVAKAALERARTELNASEVRAPISGRILKIHTRSGERIGDRGLLEMGAVTEMQAVAEVFEADIPLIQIGQTAEIVLDSSGIELSGRVAEIGHLVARKIVLTNDPVSDTDARVIEVRIDLAEGDRQRVERLSNSRVEVRIQVNSNESKMGSEREVSP